MLKRELIDEIAKEQNSYLKRDITQAVDIILDAINDAVANGQRVEIRGFGSFAVRSRKARITKNPKTGKVMDIPSRKTLNFTMSKSIKEPLVNSSK